MQTEGKLMWVWLSVTKFSCCNMSTSTSCKNVMVLEVNITKTALLIPPLSTQVFGCKLDSSWFLSFLHTPHLIHLFFGTSKRNGSHFLIFTKALYGQQWPHCWNPRPRHRCLSLDFCNCLLSGLPISLFDLLQFILHKAARLTFLKYKIDHILPSFPALNPPIAYHHSLTWLCLPLQSHLLPNPPSYSAPAILPIFLPFNTPGSFLPQVLCTYCFFASRALP